MDISLLELMNGQVGRSAIFDLFINNIYHSALVKGTVLMLMFWSLWGRSDVLDSETRGRLLAVLVIAPITVTVARISAFILPYRARPIHSDAVDVNYVNEGLHNYLDGWTSFPSDHAALFFCLSVSLFYVNRKIGVIALIYTTLIICLPRIYVGFHWPSDILAGAFLGVAIAIALTPPVTKWMTRVYSGLMGTPAMGWLYPFLFLVTFQTATLFIEARDAISLLLKTITAL